MPHQPYMKEEYSHGRQRQATMYTAQVAHDLPPPYLIPRGGGGGGGGGTSDRHARLSSGHGHQQHSGLEVTVVSPEGCHQTSSVSQSNLTQSKTHISHRRPNTDSGSSAVYHDAHVRSRLLVPPTRRADSASSASSTFDELSSCSDSICSVRSYPDKKHNHSEIEKRRRDKMNVCINELASLVPQCRALSRKLDKLTILRLAVQYVGSVRGTLTAGPLTSSPQPALLPAVEQNELVMRAATKAPCLLMVVDCDRGRFLFLSSACETLLGYKPKDLLGQSLFDILSPKDVAKVKEQLSSYNLTPRDRLIDAKTMLPMQAECAWRGGRLGAGSRRSFLCRVKCPDLCGPDSLPPGEPPAPRPTQPLKNYKSIHCTGYVKSWPPAEHECVSEAEAPAEPRASTCLVAAVRAAPSLLATCAELHQACRTNHTHLQFVSKLSSDGIFVFVDERVTFALGFLPQELIGTSVYDYLAPDPAAATSLADVHRTALRCSGPVEYPPYLFCRKDGSFAMLHSTFKRFVNPWTKELQYLVAANTVLPQHQRADADEPSPHFKQEALGQHAARMLEPQPGSSTAGHGRHHAHEPEPAVDLLHHVLFTQEPSLIEGFLNYESFPQIRNDVSLSDAGRCSSSPPVDTQPPECPEDMTPSLDSPPITPIDGNKEATMAVIMNLLEADAGLGDSSNINTLPWLLP